MPKVPFNSKAENMSFELIPDGDYIYEVVKFDQDVVSPGARKVTAGSDRVSLRMAFFNKEGKRVAMWTEDFIFHESTQWKCEVFMVSANVEAKDGEDFDWCSDNMIGLRGWCTVGHENGFTDATKDKVFNRVKVWLTDKEKLARNTPKKEESPF